MSRTPRRVAVYALTAPGAEVGRRLTAGLDESTLHLPDRLVASTGEIPFQKLGPHLAVQFTVYEAHVIIAATGIVVRAIAPLLSNKKNDPAVVVVDQAGRFAISLLSGHLGGANDLAREIAAVLDGQAVITTATDIAGQPSLEVVAADLGLAVENLGALSRLSREVVEGGRIAVFDPDDWLWPALTAWPESFQKLNAPPGNDLAPRSVVVVDHQDVEYPESWLIVRPPRLALGVGCNRGTPADDILDFIEDVLGRSGLARGSVACLATVDRKGDEAGLIQAARRLGADLRLFTAAELDRVQVPHPSGAAQKHVGTKSVCEAAAMLAAGTDRLLTTKQKTRDVTVAVALMAPRAGSL
jgi:cobalt-precorrin 5A hydrolase